MVVITDDRLTGRQGCLSLEEGRPTPSILARWLAALSQVAYGCGAGLEQLLVWQERIRQRRHLDSLDDRLLKDVGLSRADIAREVDKPFWQG